MVTASRIPDRSWFRHTGDREGRGRHFPRDYGSMNRGISSRATAMSGNRGKRFSGEIARRFSLSFVSLIGDSQMYAS